MQKGSVFPKVRARWTQGAETRTDEAPPVWARVNSCFAVFITEIEGIPVPISVNQDDCSLGLWRYDPVNGDAVWKGDWHVLDFTGNWFFRQHNDGTEWVQWTWTLMYNSIVGPRYTTRKNNPTGDHGNWPYPFAGPVGTSGAVTFDLPWVVNNGCTMVPVTYAEIRAAGIDSDNTEPATWNYTAVP